MIAYYFINFETNNTKQSEYKKRIKCVSSIIFAVSRKNKYV